MLNVLWKTIQVKHDMGMQIFCWWWKVLVFVESNLTNPAWILSEVYLELKQFLEWIIQSSEVEGWRKVISENSQKIIMESNYHIQITWVEEME